MTERVAGVALLLATVMAPAAAGAQQDSAVPEDLQTTDGGWKLAASVLTFEASVRTPSRSGTGFSCTQVLGFSQSMEWYAGLSVADDMEENAGPDLAALEPDAFLPAWQGRFFMGAAIERWTDPEFAGWSGTDRMARETPA
ncbi:MAG: hypothetical protein ACODAE_07340, partial [Gemmatimonadota bacterium]